jgi:hypothetical protein
MDLHVSVSPAAAGFWYDGSNYRDFHSRVSSNFLRIALLAVRVAFGETHFWELDQQVMEVTVIMIGSIMLYYVRFPFLVAPIGPFFFFSFPLCCLALCILR